LQSIIIHSAEKLGIQMDKDGAYELAKRSRGTPRIANRLLKRVRDFAEVQHNGIVTKGVASAALDVLDIDSMGLDRNDRKMLDAIISKFNGGPVGLDTLATSIGEDTSTIEDVIEPFLIMNGLITRTPKGRVATKLAYQQLGINYNDEA
jgi:Holliday junction DNA helicase RuvB